jgi:hypothetical protein
VCAAASRETQYVCRISGRQSINAS